MTRPRLRLLTRRTPRVPGPAPARGSRRLPGASPARRGRWLLAPAAAAAVLIAGCGSPHHADPQAGTAPASARRSAARPSATSGGTPQRTPAGRRAGQQGTAATARNDPAAGDSPAGFWYGTDSWPVTLIGGRPWHEPVKGGSPGYGGYIGMAGNWARWAGCGGNIAWSTADAAAANVNYRTYHEGIGTGVYWYMAGPGVDPHYNGTMAEASAWGAAQAAATLRAMPPLHVTYPVVWMDVEQPGIPPALDNGWDNAYTSPCSGRVATPGMAPAVDRAVLDGYQAYLTAHSSYRAGVYSSPLIWNVIFGTGAAASIPGLDEWTYTDGTRSISPAPRGWCIPGTSTCAHFFGGVTAASPHAVMWQWSGGGGLSNGVGDFDQIDAAHVR